MKILILGLGKSGTTAMVYKTAGGLPNCLAFSGGVPGKYLGNHENAVYKHTYEARKGKDFDLYREHLKHQSYDRKVWMARDPRDAAVSRMLYRWHKGCVGRKKQYRAHLDLVLQKEKDPAAVPFYEVYRFAGHGDWPMSKQEVFEEEKLRYREMTDFVQGLDNDWFLFTYEDMIERRFDKLNAYLGFAVAPDAEVPRSTGKDKVVRKKATGDWRHWFTEADVELLKPAYLPYMEAIGYDLNDWSTDPAPAIEPEFSSLYMQNLTRKATKNIILRYADPLLQRLLHRN
jgi:hypothetical protein